MLVNLVKMYSLAKFGIVQFDGTEFDHWKYRMEIILDQNNVQEQKTKSAKP